MNIFRSNNAAYHQQQALFVYFGKVLAKVGTLVLVSSMLVSCASMRIGTSRYPVPADMVALATIPGAEGMLIRYMSGDSLVSKSAGTAQLLKQNAIVLSKTKKLDYLTLSGGGFNGAYGTGFLRGWTARGDRPQFEVVTGISVGALIAPFAFLGTNYDDALLTAFNMITQSTNAGAGILGLALGADSYASNASLKAALATIITEETLAKIGAEHSNGRRLLIGTTNLDIERPVVWDIGAIAVSRIADKVGLVRKILLASAALPAIYPPVLINVEAKGIAYDELHVDGGVSQQIVLLPEDLNLRAFDRQHGVRQTRNLYVVFNGKLAPNYEPVKAMGMSIMLRTMPAFIKSLGVGDVVRLRTAAQSNSVSFKLNAIPEGFEVSNDFPPKAEYLQSLIAVGFEAGKSGDWMD